MKIYRVKVNGKVYKVELESIEEVKGSISFTKPKTESTKEVEKTVVQNNEVVNVAPAEGARVKAFMQGKIIDIAVKVGQALLLFSLT